MCGEFVGRSIKWLMVMMVMSSYVCFTRLVYKSTLHADILCSCFSKLKIAGIATQLSVSRGAEVLSCARGSN